MLGSFLLGRVAGVPIRVHSTFVFVLLLGALHWGRRHGIGGEAGSLGG